jgi:hypothetical protein
MRRLVPGALLLFSLAAVAPAATLRLIELRGHARILAMDEPILKGRIFVFHRYPDGTFLSVPAENVLGIATTKVEEEKTKFRPGETIVLGPTGEGSPEEAFRPRRGAAPPPVPPYSDYPYALYPYVGCCSGPLPPPPPSTPPPPSLIGPNGFPGTPTREIGPNGFPILGPANPPAR